MNQVVSFLSELAVTEEHSGVRRTLGVCVEFERIAKIVLDRAEKESHSRRKRKNKETMEEAPAPTPLPQVRTPSSTPFTSPDPTVIFANPDFNQSSFKDFPPPPPHSENVIPNPVEFNSPPPGTYQNLMDIVNGLSPDFSNDLPGYPSSDGLSPVNGGAFDQPFVPQDLWQMPMTLEWDWAEMTNIGDPPYGIMDNSQQPPTPSNGN